MYLVFNESVFYKIMNKSISSDTKRLVLKKDDSLDVQRKYLMEKISQFSNFIEVTSDSAFEK